MGKGLVIGGGIFGVTAARALRARGYEVTLVERGRVPDPRAASTDLSKVCRLEYGSDARLMACMERAREGWLAWNERFGEELFRECGVLMVCAGEMAPGGFEYESWRTLGERGHRPERVRGAELERRFPAWRGGRFQDGFFHAKGGYARSANVVAALAQELRASGVELLERRSVVRLLERGGAVVGAMLADGTELEADFVVLATGSWTPALEGRLAGPLRASGHAVFHLRPERPEGFGAERFPVFTADIARTGFYGFPLERGVVKLALHDAGVELGCDHATRAEVPEASPGDVERLRAFLDEAFPDLARAELVGTRLCPYSDTWDGDFWIARDPERAGLTVAAGGSGHAFKFAPLLGDWIADAVEGRDGELSARTRWRTEPPAQRSHEEARCPTPRG